MNKLLFSIILTVFLLNTNVFSQNKQFNLQSNSFVKNIGQFDDLTVNHQDILLGYHQTPFSILFTDNGLIYRFDKIEKINGKRRNHSETVSFNWLNCNDNVIIEYVDETTFHYTYKIKNKSQSTKGYNKVIYKNIYNNIDVVFTLSEQTGIKYSYILHPGANPNNIQVKYNYNSTNKLSLKNNQLEISTPLGKIIESKPFTFYSNTKKTISSQYVFNNDIISFQLENYNPNQTIIIDPWVYTPTFASSNAVWEVETDGLGNIYAIGGENPMLLKKFDSNGSLLWTYSTPWDTTTFWLGTLKTDPQGYSYLTSGSAPRIQKIDALGNFIWEAYDSLNNMSEYWSITFNCSNDKLIIGGAQMDISNFGHNYSAIYEFDKNNGQFLYDTIFNFVDVSQSNVTPIEVRSITTSPSGNYVYLTHNHVGSTNLVTPNFQINRNQILSYKAENFKPSIQNGAPLSSIETSSNYIYVNGGDSLYKYDINNGNFIDATNIPGGIVITNFFNKDIVGNSGIAIDSCDNIYVGSSDRVVKYDANLNFIADSLLSFCVYDLCLGSNGNIIVGGAVENNNFTGNRIGKIQSISFNACISIPTYCCNSNFTLTDTVCYSDTSFQIIPDSLGGYFVGNGVDSSGLFNPSLAGNGYHNITYILNCGSQTKQIFVNPCDTNCSATIQPPFTTIFCQNDLPITLVSTDNSGTWSGNGIDPNTGVFSPPIAGPGNHTIYYTINASCFDIDSITLTVYPLDDATFNYSDSIYCINDPNPIPSVNFPGGSFIIDNGGVIDGNTGEINLLVTGVGTYTITYITSNLCANYSTKTITIVNSPNTTIFQAGPFCETDPDVNLNAVNGGGIWSGTGIIDANLGTFSPSVAGVGTHIITYTISGTCASSSTSTIIVNAIDDASFTYSSNIYCSTDANPIPTITGNAGGIFSINNGGVINAITGEIDLNSTTPGQYQVNYTTSGTCASTSTTSLTIMSIDTTLFVSNDTIFTNEQNGTITWLDCDNNYSIIPNEINHYYSPNSNGNYSAVISYNGCVDTTNCINYIYSDINHINDDQINIYPNPFSNIVYINLNKLESVNIRIISAQGKIVYSKTQVNNEILAINLDISNGVYIVEISNETTKKYFKLIKE